MLKYYVLIIFSLSSFSASSALMPGDILLQPLDCKVCDLIENEENSIYSHIGLYLGNSQVIEAYGQVRIVSLKAFLLKGQKGQKVQVRRLRDKADFSNLTFEAQKLIGHPYDRQFLWDNKINNKEALYCSELVYKLLVQTVYLKHLKPKKMHFDFRPYEWDKYFNFKTPRGLMGLSPADFERSQDFEYLYEI